MTNVLAEVPKYRLPGHGIVKDVANHLKSVHPKMLFFLPEIECYRPIVNPFSLPIHKPQYGRNG